ncbi:GerW family sporulation protein [Methanobrevibacter sp. DSM 116169]|uniref:GerW family sporulation protein n=1 Tax=Methanobrevibacter sp. DSM 116169 TaxID=3242727 RepID=UPI0038FC4959
MQADDVKTIVDELHKLINIKNFVGESIETETATLIPVMRTGMGFGSGSDAVEKTGMQAMAAGAGVEPVSMVVILKGVEGPESVRVLNLSKGNDLNKALSDLTPVITELIKEIIPKDDDDDYDEGEYIPPNKIEIKDEE